MSINKNMDGHDDSLMDEETQLKVLTNFAEKLISNQKDIPPKYQKLASEHFWELI